MQVYFIRHGSTAGNLERRYVGSTDESLTEAAAELLKQHKDRYPQPEVVFTSPLKRCLETAELLFPGKDPEILKGLRECDFGEFEYKNYQELQGDERYQQWIDSGGTISFPKGESRAQFTRRCCEAFLEGCCRILEGGVSSAAFVVHGGTIMAVLDQFSSPHRDYFDWQAGNGQGFSGTLSVDERGRITVSQIRSIGNIPETNTDIVPESTGIEEHYVMKQNKKLRCGFTTGSCAAAAATAAARMLLTGNLCSRVDLMTPKGILLHLPVVEQKIHEDRAVCAVKKFAGDDPDATDGMLIYATAEYGPDSGTVPPDTKSRAGSGQAPGRVFIEGGIGVGRVTRPGLEQPVGAAAINRVPREMITGQVEAVCQELDFDGSIKITISAPEGVEIGKKTFNPHIGIQGGISILGTSGIVMPMSEEALIASIRLEMKQKYANGSRYLLITPGNYGADFIRRREISEKLDAGHSMKCSNFVGETIDMAVELGFAGILFVAHIGKFIKVSGGIMNTHSAEADCRAELMAAQAMRAALKQGRTDSETVSETVAKLLNTNTTEEAVALLKEAGLLEATMEETAERIQFYLQKRCRGLIKTEAVLFSNQMGYLGETVGAEEMIEQIICETENSVSALS